MAESDELDFNDVVQSISDLVERVHEVILAASGRPDEESRYQDDLDAAGGAAEQKIIRAGVERLSSPLIAGGNSCRTMAKVLLGDPVPFAVGPIARAGMEAAATVLWLLDPKLPWSGRAQRVLSLAHRDHREGSQILFAMEADGEDYAGLVQESRAHLQGQWAEFSTWAEEAGLIRSRLPGRVELFREMLGAEFEYRLYSGIEHSSPVAVKYQVNLGDGAFVLTAMMDVADAYARSVWATTAYLAPATSPALKSVLDNVYDRLHFNPTLRWFAMPVPNPWDHKQGSGGQRASSRGY